MLGPAPAHALCCWGHLTRTTSALAGPWCAKVPQTVYDQACAAWGTCLAHQRGLAMSGCLDQYRFMPCVSGGTSLAQHRHQWHLGSAKCLEQSRHMLVLLGAPVSHTINTSEALVHADAWTSIGSCLVLLGAPGWHNIGSSATLVRQGASNNLDLCL